LTEGTRVMKHLSIAISVVLAAAVAPADEYLDPRGRIE